MSLIQKDELDGLELAWWYKLCYHENNLLLLIQELDGLGFGYTSLLINHARSNKIDGKGDQSSCCSLHKGFNTAPSEMYGINYEAQFYAELRAYHDVCLLYTSLFLRDLQFLSYEAKYGWILVKEISSCPHELTDVLEALLDDLNDIGPPPPHEPASSRPDDVERVFDTRVYLEAPSIAAVLRDEPQEAKDSIEKFRQLNPYFPCFLLGFKHGDRIPHFRDAQAIVTRTRVSHSMVCRRHTMATSVS